MEQTLEATSTINGHKKPPLLKQWMQANPDLHPYIRPKEWFFFLQFIVKSLKTYDDKEIDSYIEDQLPKLFKDDVPFSKVSDAFTYLRFLLLKHILDDPNTSQENKDHGTIRLISFFDTIFKLVRDRYPAEADGVSSAILPESPISDELTLLKFQIEENRFSGKGHLDTALAQWIGLESAQASSFSRWKSIVHPDDFKSVEDVIYQLAQRKHPIYEIKYRLKNRSSNWKTVVEFGKINFDEKGVATDFVGVIIDKSTSSPKKTIDSSLSEILEYILDSKKDITFITDQNGCLVHVSRLLLRYLINDRGPLFNSRTWLNMGEPFFELLDDENKAIAKNYWNMVSPEFAPSKKLLLKLRSDRKGREKIVEFTPLVLEKNLKAPHYVLWGNAVPRRKIADVFNERLAILANLGKELPQLSDLNSFYKKVLEAIQQLIPKAQAAAILIKSPKGFEYGIGFGYKNDVLHNKLILAQDRISHLETDNGKNQVFEIELVQDQDIKNEICEKLSEPPFNKASVNGAPEDGEHQLVGLIKAGNTPYAILELNTFGSREYFKNSECNTLKLVLQQASAALTNHFLTHRLQESEVNYSTVFEKSPLAVYILQDDEVKLTNVKLLQLLGLEYDNNEKIDIWKLVHPGDLSGLRKQLAQLNGELAYSEKEFRLVNKYGEIVFCTGIFQHIQYNNRPAVMCEILDITRIRKLERQLVQAQKMETLGTLAADIAHDFNNILAAIIPSAQLIINHPAQYKVNNERAKTIFHMAQRAAALTQKLLTYSRAEIELPRVFSLNDLILETQDMLDKMTGPAIQIHYKLENQLPPVSGEYNQFVQMLVNLVVNARDALARGGDIHISTSQKIVTQKAGSNRALSPGMYVQLEVKDNGTGIPREIRKQIFKPFFSTRASEDRSGLGLSIVYGILKKHDGYIMLQSLENEGSTFKIYLPASDDLPKEIGPEAEFITIQAQPKDRKTILIVDDEKNLRDVFSGMIKFFGYNILEASSGKEAIKIYQDLQSEIDLVIIDYAMPGISGGETYEALKHINPAVETLLCTGYSEKEEVANLVKSEHLHLLPKPFTIETLEQKIKEALRETHPGN